MPRTPSVTYCRPARAAALRCSPLKRYSFQAVEELLGLLERSHVHRVVLGAGAGAAELHAGKDVGADDTHALARAGLAKVRLHTLDLQGGLGRHRLAARDVRHRAIARTQLLSSF